MSTHKAFLFPPLEMTAVPCQVKGFVAGCPYVVHGQRQWIISRVLKEWDEVAVGSNPGIGRIYPLIKSGFT